jgi:hypothetical protein
MKIYISNNIFQFVEKDVTFKITEIDEEEFWELAKNHSSFSEFDKTQKAVILFCALDLDLENKGFIKILKKVEYLPKKIIMKVQTRMAVGRQDKKIEIPYTGEPLFGNQKIYVRNLAKDHQNYGIKVDNGGVNGTNEKGEPIPIDTLGKWLFGVPQYKGHILFDIHQTANAPIVCYVPQGCPQEVIDMLESL